ncbi:Put7p [Sporobolomyces salmoneus]|uniref:Put7p n=1 Tax=Sporobolomyces salmoneus TaxID=183962 RepID=UPI003181722B
MSSSSRFLLSSLSRPLASTSKSTYTPSSVPYTTASTPLRNPSEDSHGSKLASASTSKRLRPRDRLQFIEASEQKTDDPTSPPSADSSGSPPNSPGLPPLASTSSPSSSSSSASSSSNPDPSPHDGSIILDPPYSGLPPLHTHPFHLPRIPFSTHRLIRQLERQEVPRGTAEVLSGLTKKLILREEERVRDDLLSKQDLENEAYLFSAALNELKTGSQVKSRNDSITLKSLTASLQRESDSVEQKMKEDMQRLQSDIQLEMNARKEETGTELQGLEMKIMDLNSKFTILLGEVRTEIEATKWISTRRVMTAIVIVVVSVVGWFASVPSSSSKTPEAVTSLPSIEELGVKPDLHEDEAAAVQGGPPGSGWSFWGSGTTPAAPTLNAQAGGKRVGEQEQ